MKIGILGSGAVGMALAGGLYKKHEIMMGTGHPDKLDDFVKQHEGVKVGNFKDTADFGELIIFAVRGAGAEKTLDEIKDVIKGKTIMDTTNPITGDKPPQDGVLSFFTSLDKSFMERLVEQAPEANFVKAFNSVGAAAMANPDFKGQTPTMFICGDSDDAKKQVSDIVRELGWEPEDMGTAKAARAIEPLCMLWCIPGFRSNDWMHGFKMLRP